MFRITNLTLMDRKYPNALAYIKIESVIRVKQKLWAVKIWAKMIWKQLSSLDFLNNFDENDFSAACAFQLYSRLL